ncbi:hypothetical protein IM538_05190 [Cytobacillus suaedae]|nr:hypothetical protein IM538_05190 [Cytobacillus suaedae]
MIPQQFGTETNIKLPLSFILYALFAFISSQLIILFSGQFVVNGIFRTPSLWSAAHLLVLGWALMIAMGSMYQLVPVAFLTKIWSERFGFLQFAVSSVGITLLSIALYVFPSLILYGAVLSVIGILMFLFQMFMTMKQQVAKNILTVFVGCALLCLLLTILLGLLLAINMSTSVGLNHMFLLKSHILLGVTGWFTLLIFGFSYKMVPMFSLAHGFSMDLSKWVLSFYLTGLVITVISFNNASDGLFQFGMLLLTLGFGTFSFHIYKILKTRLKKKLDKPFTFSLIAIGIGLLIHISATLIGFFPEHYAVFGILIYLYIYMWIIFSIAGYLYKIVPFLWWTHRYSKLIGKTNVPTLKDMMNEKASVLIFAGFMLGSIGIVLSYLMSNQMVFIVSQGIQSIATMFYCYRIFAVLRK